MGRLAALTLGLYVTAMAAAAAADSEPTANVVFAADVRQVERRMDPVDIRDSFGCGEPVNAVIAIAGLSLGEHVIAANWVRPDGTIQKTQQGKLDVTNENWVTYLSSSITVLEVDPEPGQEKQTSPFAGSWMVEVFADDSLIEASTITVDC